jgi:hypothetical protein
MELNIKISRSVCWLILLLLAGLLGWRLYKRQHMAAKPAPAMVKPTPRKTAMPFTAGKEAVAGDQATATVVVKKPSPRRTRQRQTVTPLRSREEMEAEVQAGIDKMNENIQRVRNEYTARRAAQSPTTEAS